jgi:hypothetical protein
MEDVYEVLAADHEEISAVLDELDKGPTAATGACEDQLMLRKMMTEELIVEEAKHADAERMYLWPTVREHVTGGGPLADRAICQQLEIGELLAQLAPPTPGSRRCSAGLSGPAGSTSTSRRGRCGRGCGRSSP